MNTTSLNPKAQEGDDSQNITHFCTALYSVTDPNLFANFALESSLSLVGASSGSFFLWDEFKKQLLLRAVRGTSPGRLGSGQVKLQEGILGWVGREGHPVWVKDLRGDSRFHQFKRKGSYRSGSFISVPLLVHHKLLGVLNITERENLAPFEQFDFQKIQSYAKIIAPAYENLKYRRRLQGENENLARKAVHLEQRLKENEPLAAVGKLARNLTHELNNPMDAIRRYVNLALDESLEDSLSREYLLKAKKGIRRAIQVIRGLLLFSRESHNRNGRLTDLHQIIDQSLEAVRQDPAFHQVYIEKSLQGTCAHVQDYGLALVFRNLYRNALEAMHGKGTLRVEASCREQWVRVSVAESGEGIPDSVRPRLFEAFSSSKNHEQGTGIGLALSKEIVERSGGKIHCESEPGKGTSFIIQLPCFRPQKGAA